VISSGLSRRRRWSSTGVEKATGEFSLDMHGLASCCR